MSAAKDLVCKINDLKEQLAVEKEICRVKEEQIKILEEQRNMAMKFLKHSRSFTVDEIAEMFGMHKANVFDILINN